MVNEKKMLSDWLLASDIDGTLNNKHRTLPKRNYDAIQKYVYELGGNFILASGRSIESMRKHFQKLNLNSGYAVFVNGAGIYDYKNDKIIWKCELSLDTVKMIKTAAKKFKSVTAQVITTENVYLVKPTVSAVILALSSKLEIKRFRHYDDIPDEGWCKVIFTGLPWDINRVEKFVKEHNGGKTENLMKSSIFSFEVVNENTNKGVAVLKTAELIGVDPSKTAAIGDYFNDYQMLKSVAVPACCGQAPQGMKDIAKLVTCHCDKGAVADLIEYIIKNHETL